MKFSRLLLTSHPVLQRLRGAVSAGHGRSDVPLEMRQHDLEMPPSVSALRAAARIERVAKSRALRLVPKTGRKRLTAGQIACHTCHVRDLRGGTSGAYGACADSHATRAVFWGPDAPRVWLDVGGKSEPRPVVALHPPSRDGQQRASCRYQYLAWRTKLRSGNTAFSRTRFWLTCSSFCLST